MKVKFHRAIGVLIMGYVFLYLPLFIVITYSFNSSRIMSVWQGFSFEWYNALLENDALFTAVLSSLKIASVAATMAMALGTLAAVITVRLKHMKSRHLLQGMIASPLVMPDVMSGLALLLVFVSIQQTFGWPSQRGMWSVTIAHITLGMAYAYLVIQARLQDFDHSLEEAALDLGSRPFTVFRTITIPMIAPSLLSAWLLAFALSLDDVVLASFLSGPGATTLPMLIFSNIRLGISPEINALATLIIVVVMIIVAISGILMVRGKRH
ncbi:MAG: ABC transporter permease subunit [Alphaproteobacteria bacterium]|nr:ABC transporter permease subunit [Alphaproteobacteria bacterium]